MASNLAHWLRSYKAEFVILILGLSHQVLQKVIGIKLSWFDNYGDDLLAVPFISSCVLIMENFIVYKDHKRKHSFLQLLFLFGLISVFFELIAPKLSSAYTFDYLDILYYFIGFLIYYYIIKKAS